MSYNSITILMGGGVSYDNNETLNDYRNFINKYLLKGG